MIIVVPTTPYLFIRMYIVLNSTTYLAYIQKGLTHLPKLLLEQWTRKFHNYMKKMYNLPHSLTFNEKMALLNDSMKVTFVRHPFVRLVSAYQDKIVDHPYKNWTQHCFTFPTC